MDRKIAEKLRSVFSERDFQVSVFSSRVTCFDIAAKKKKASYLVKIEKNIDSIQPHQATLLKAACRICYSTPVVVGDSARRDIEDNVIYTRYDVPAMTVKTLTHFIDGKPVFTTDSGGVRMPIENLKEERQRMGYSIRHLARIVSVSPTMIKRYESGEAYPSERTAEKLMEALSEKIFRSPEVRVKDEGFTKTRITRKLRRAGIDSEEVERPPFDIYARRKEKKIITLSRDVSKRAASHMEKFREIFESRPLFIGKRKDKFRRIRVVPEKELEDELR